MVTLKIIDESGWSKNIPIEKAITRVGRSSTNDICLASLKIAPVHLQILSSPDLPTSCRVVNLTEKLEVIQGDEAQSLGAFGILDVNDRTVLKLGEYKLAFDVPLVTYRIEKTNSMEASLSFSGAVLRTDLPLEGLLVLKNIGERNSTQFQVNLQGFPEDCYQIDPVPLLYAGAQEEVRVRFFHQTLYPSAGMHEVTFVIDAPESYPGDEIMIPQSIYVMPVFKQTLELSDDAVLQKVEEAPLPVIEPQTEKPVSSRVEVMPLEPPLKQEPAITSAAEPVVEEQPQSIADDEIEAQAVDSSEKVELSPVKNDGLFESRQVSRMKEFAEETSETDGAPVEVPLIPVERLAEKPEPVKAQVVEELKNTIPDTPVTTNEREGVRQQSFSGDDEKMDGPVPGVVSDIPVAEKITVERPKMKVVRSQTHDFWDEE